MGNGKKEVVVGLKIKAKIDEALDNVKTLKDELNNFELSKGVSAEFAKEFKKIENQLDELQRKTASGEISLIDAKGAEKALDKIEKDWEYLVGKLSGQNLLGKNLKEDAAALKLLESLQASYTKGIKEAESQQSKLSRQLDKAKQAETELLETQKSQQVVSEQQLRNQKERAVIADREAKEARKLRNEAEQALREKIAGSNGKYSADDITKKGSNLRKTEAYRNFAAAQAAYDAAEQTNKKESNKAASMVTKDMQIAAAQEAKKAVEAADKALKDYQQTALETAKIDAFEKAKESVKKMAEFGDVDWEGLGINLDEIKTIEQLTAALEQLQTQASGKTAKAVGKIGKAAEQGSKGVREMGAEVSATKDALEDLNKEAAQVAEFENKIKSFLGLAGAAEVLKRAVRDAMATIKELDATMTEMSVVTDLTVGDYWDQLPEYSQRASDLGISINSAYKAATLYYQQGLKTNEVNAISAETLKMAKIAGLDAAEATDKMTAALRGFNMELNETSAQRVADVYSELAAITAADTKEIANAMTKTASIASNAGMEFETTAAFLSQIIETTRESAETAGTAMKTVIARFQELKKDPSEIGQVEGEIVDANKIETALRSVGVALRDSSGQFRDLDDVFLELASKWETLDTNTQRYIATIAAGSRQQSRFIAMMSNYGRTQELVAAANNSAGASNKQFEKTMDSLEAKVAKLENAWHEFTMGIMNSDLVKTGIDILTKLLEIINKATNSFNGLAGSITKILGIVAVFKLGKTIFNKLREPMVKFFADIVREAGITGERAGNAAKAGLERSKQQQLDKTNAELPEGYKYDKNGKLHKNGQFVSNEEQKMIEDQLGLNKKEGFNQKINNFVGDKTGWNDFSQGLTQLTARKTLLSEIASKEEEISKLKATINVDSKDAEKAQETIDKLTNELETLKNKQKNFVDESQKGWENVGKGVGQFGQAMTGVGVAISLVGGALSSLGLEEVGETLSTVGNYATMAGAAFSALGNLIPMVAKVAAAAGISVAAAWAWLAAIAAAIVAIGAGIVLTAKAVQETSPEGQMKKAAEATEAARKAANEAAEAYADLTQSLEDLENSQDALKELTKGTDEWKEAVSQLNKQVSELIDKYPALASLVTYTDGILNLDTDSNEVQDIIDAYEKQTFLAKGAVLMGNMRQAQTTLRGEEFANLSGVKEAADYNLYHADNIFSRATAKNYVYTQDENFFKATQALSKEIAAKPKMTETEIEESLVRNGVDENMAEWAAEGFVNDTAALIKFGQAVEDTERQIEGYYEALAYQTQQMIDLGKWSDSALNQMSTVFDKDLMQDLQSTELERLSNLDKHQLATEKQSYASAIYGAGAKIDGDKVVDAQGNVLRTFATDAEWLEEMSAYSAMKKGSTLMEEIPGAIINSIKDLDRENQNIISKAFEGKSLTREEHEAFKTIYGSGVGADSMWKNLTREQKMAYGWSGKNDDIEGLERAKEAYKKTFSDIIEATEEAFDQVVAIEDNLDIDISDKLSSATAQAWGQTLEEISFGATKQEIDTLNRALNTMISDMTTENANLVMSEINAMDKMDIASWDQLGEALAELDIEPDVNALNALAEAGKNAYNAIVRINFDTLAQDINNIYKTLDKTKEGNRTYSESDYKELIAANNALKDEFIQIGDEFLYIGGTMEELVEALEKNTLAKLNEANKQLSNKIAISEIIADNAPGYSANFDGMDTIDLLTYLTDMRYNIAASGLDIAELGISGLSNNTEFSKADKDTLVTWATALASEGGKQNQYKTTYADQLYDANVLRYTRNDASYNAEMSVDGGEYAKAHEDALIAQAIQSGGVSNDLIEAYKNATGEMKKELGKKIAEGVNKIVENGTGRDAYKELIDKVENAMRSNRQKEIDKLSEINESINNTNQRLIDKIQEQIDYDRQQDALNEAKENLSDLYARQAYLGVDTSGANTLEQKAIDEEIKNAEKELEQTMIDQSIQDLANANEKASEQRERQIALMQDQLDWESDNGLTYDRAKAAVDDALDDMAKDPTIAWDTTTLGSLLYGAEGDSLSGLAKEDWASHMQTIVTAASNWSKQNAPAAGSGNTTGDGKTDEKGADEKGELTENEKTALETKKREETIANAKSAAKASLESTTGGGFTEQNSELKKAYSIYEEAVRSGGGTPLGLEDFAKESLGSGKNIHMNDFSVVGSAYHSSAFLANNFDWKDGKKKADDGYVLNKNNYVFSATIDGTDSDAATVALARGIENDAMFKYGERYFIYHGGLAYNLTRIKDTAKNTGWMEPKERFKTGGLADFTGPAWLDGTKSKPEIVLNQTDSANFIQLRDILADILHGTSALSKTGSKDRGGDNYFDIEISVENLNDDYDVEQLANKIRKMLYEDATYRNVNAINLIR